METLETTFLGNVIFRGTLEFVEKLYCTFLYIEMHCMNRATHCKVHTPLPPSLPPPPPPAMWKIFEIYTRDCEFSDTPTICVIFRSGLFQREYILYLEVPNELIYLKFTLPQVEMFS